MEDEAVSRTNEMWQTQLCGKVNGQEKAINDLRVALYKNLRQVLYAQSLPYELWLEDAVQEALIRITQNLSDFEGRSKFMTWATAIAIRTAMSELRRKHWKDVSLDSLLEVQSNDSSMDMIGDNVDSDTSYEQQMIFDKLHELIQSDLTEKQRKALIAELRGVTLEEIANQLGSNRNAIYKLTHDARKRLKAGLEAADYLASDINAAYK